MSQDKSNQKSWARRCNYILKCYEKFLLLVNSPEKFLVKETEQTSQEQKELNDKNNKTIKEALSVIRLNCLYIPEYRESIPMLIRNYNSNYCSTELV